MKSAGIDQHGSMADVYDLIYPDSAEAVAAAEFVVELCPDGGSVLELGIGTGRVARHIVEHGVKVYGIDASPDMLTKLRERDQSDKIMAIEGDFSKVTIDGQVDVVLVAANTLGALMTQDLQVETLLRISEQLEDGGYVVLETIGPACLYTRSYPFTSAHSFFADSIVIATAQADKATQTATATYFVIDSAGVRIGRESGRHIWPAELDLMARIAGLRLVDRWSGWRKEPLTESHDRLISVYQNV